MVMKKVYTADSPAIALAFPKCFRTTWDCLSWLRMIFFILLEGKYLSMSALPEVWVQEGLNAKYAESIIQSIENNESTKNDMWLCQRCGESNFESFDICWRCNA